MTNQSEEHPGNVDKIREIIFGGQMREYDTRFGNLEEALRKDAAQLNSELRSRIENTQNSLNGEISLIRQEVAREAADRKKSFQEFDSKMEAQLGKVISEFKETVDKLNSAIAKIEKKHDDDQKTMNSQIVEQSKFIYKDFQEKSNSLQSQLNAKTQSVEERMTDRSLLAESLRKIADTLSNTEPSSLGSHSSSSKPTKSPQHSPASASPLDSKTAPSGKAKPSAFQ